MLPTAWVLLTNKQHLDPPQETYQLVISVHLFDHPFGCVRPAVGGHFSWGIWLEWLESTSGSGCFPVTPHYFQSFPSLPHHFPLTSDFQKTPPHFLDFFPREKWRPLPLTTRSEAFLNENWEGALTRRLFQGTSSFSLNWWMMVDLNGGIGPEWLGFWGTGRPEDDFLRFQKNGDFLFFF